MRTPFSHRPFPPPLQASPTTVPAAGARPRQDGIFPTLPHLASGTKRDAPRAHPRRKSRRSAADLKPPALSDPHSSPQATDSSGANTALDFKNKNLKIPTRDNCWAPFAHCGGSAVGAEKQLFTANEYNQVK